MKQKVSLYRLQPAAFSQFRIFFLSLAMIFLGHVHATVPFSSSIIHAAPNEVIVASDGSGDYTGLQAAIDHAPDNLHSPYRIRIKKGYYYGQIHIPASKPYIVLIGDDPDETFIAYGDGKGGTSTLTVDASNCSILNLTIMNTAGAVADGPQSLAIKTQGDKIIIHNCRFISGQDTVFVRKKGTRVYISHCYIDGNTDFIYGGSIAVFEDCVIYPRDRVDNGKGGYITAANTPKGQAYGLIFLNCQIPDNHGITQYTLGRPWQNDRSTQTQGRERAENKVVFCQTKMGASIKKEGWSIWNEGTQTDVITDAEYNSTHFNGIPIDVSQRVAWSIQLNKTTAAPYKDLNKVFAGWDPKAELAGLEQSSPPNTRFMGMYAFGENRHCLYE